jgi:ElaB/YqjD/DUF883 family membrane-anchored ribosome-binding protein
MAKLSYYDTLTARERRFIDIVNRGITKAHLELRGVRATIESISVPAGSRNIDHKEIVHLRTDLLEMLTIIDEVYKEWATICTRAHARLDEQLRISASENLEATRHRLEHLEKAELEAKVERLRATKFLKAAIPASFTFGSVLSVHSIQHKAFAPEDNVSGIIGVVCVVSALIMLAIYRKEHRREVEIVRRIYGEG